MTSIFRIFSEMPNAAGGSIASRQLPLDYYLEIGVLL
jgi:hypothetical protein